MIYKRFALERHLICCVDDASAKVDNGVLLRSKLSENGGLVHGANTRILQSKHILESCVPHLLVCTDWKAGRFPSILHQCVLDLIQLRTYEREVAVQTASQTRLCSSSFIFALCISEN